MNVTATTGPQRWPADQENRFRRMITITMLVTRFGPDPLPIEKLRSQLNDAYHYSVALGDLLRDIGTLEELRVIKRPTPDSLTFVGNREFWPFGGDV